MIRIIRKPGLCVRKGYEIDTTPTVIEGYESANRDIEVIQSQKDR